MAKRKEYWEKLLENLMKLEPNKWYKIHDRPDYEQFVETVKMFIDSWYPFTFSEDYRKLRLEREIVPYKHIPWHKMEPLPDGVTISKIDRGHKEKIQYKDKMFHVEHSGTSYRVFYNQQLIAIE